MRAAVTLILLLLLMAGFLVYFVFIRPTRPYDGKALYAQHCESCHGKEGRGDGFVAKYITVQPRDFTKGIFKFKSVQGAMPSDEDLFRTITEGIEPGGMLPFEDDLTEEARKALVEYTKELTVHKFIIERQEDIERFGDAVVKQGEEDGKKYALVNLFKLRGIGKPIPVPEPTPPSKELTELGKELYQAACADCHGETGKGDGPSAPTLKDDWGYPIPPLDFTIGAFKRGYELDDLYLSILAGVGGTPMPSYADTLETEKERWALIYYTKSLVKVKPPTLKFVGDAKIGLDLFTGVSSFQNGGSACIACHSAGGLGALGGGILGPDLSWTYTKFGEGFDEFMSDLPSSAFPVMNAVFKDKPLTPEEKAHLKAFFQQTSLARRPAEIVAQLFLMAVAGAAILLVLINLIWYRRLTIVRRPLLELGG